MLRLQSGLTVTAVAKRIETQKGYISQIENHQVNPPSMKIVLRFAKLFHEDARCLARLAWVDKAPAELHEDAERFLEWVQREDLASPNVAPPALKRPSAQGGRKC